MQDSTQYLWLALLAYPYFWFHSFDPNLRIRVYSGAPPKEMLGDTFNMVPGPISYSAIAWTAILVLPVALPKILPDEWRTACDLHPSSIWSLNFLLSAAVVVIATKILFSPGNAAFKSYELAPNSRCHRGWRLIAFDWLTVFPVNYFQSLVTKFVFLPVAWAAVWLMSKLGWEFGTTDVIPDYIFVAWTFMYFGRVATFFQKRLEIEDAYGTRSPLHAGIRLPPFMDTVANRLRWSYWQRVRLWLWLSGSWFVVWMLVEKTLRECGSPSNTLPSLSLIVAGLILTPIIEILVGVITGGLEELNGR